MTLRLKNCPLDTRGRSHDQNGHFIHLGLSHGNGSRAGIQFGKVVADQSYPDDRWAHLAAGIAGLIEFPASWPGSHLKPRATAFVVFYNYNMPGLDRSKVMLLPTSSNAPPNMLAVLVIEKGHQTNSADLTRGSLVIFELAM